jgi:thiamine transporter ThiT
VGHWLFSIVQILRLLRTNFCALLLTALACSSFHAFVLDFSSQLTAYGVRSVTVGMVSVFVITWR